MTDLSNKTAIVVDGGYFIELAFRMARDFGRVFFCHPSYQKPQTGLNEVCIGDGFSEIKWLDEPEEMIDNGEVDLVVFPDVNLPKRQLHFEKLGVPVWGGRKANWLELKKLAWKKWQEEHGLDFSEYEEIVGIDALREHCQQVKDRWIKLTPQYRGFRETFHHIDYPSSRQEIDSMAAESDLLQTALRFISEKPIKSNIEGGLDTYTIDGQHPDVAVQGYEKKDKCYFATVMPYQQIPEEIRGPSDALWGLLRELQCRQFISSEVKVTDDGQSILLDNTIRLPSPAGEEQMELYDNISQIIYEGAQGRLVQPVLTARFACEAMIEHHGDNEHWRSLVVPESVRQWVKLYCSTFRDGRIGIAPLGHDIIGAVVGIGDTPKQALEHCQENAEALKDQNVTVHMEAMAGVLQEIEEAQEKGIHFTEKPMPEPVEAIS